MADVVLANLSIDASGVVSGINQGAAAMARGDTALGKFGRSQITLGGISDQLVGKMFSLKRVIGTLATSFGIAGIVLSLASAVKDLVADLVTGTTWFKNIKESVTDWYMELAHGEDSLGRIGRKMKELTAGTGVESTTELVQALTDLQKKRAELESQVGQFPRSSTMGRALAEDLESFDKKIDETVLKLTKLGFSMKQLGAQREMARLLASGGTGAGAVVDLTKPGGEIVPKETLSREAGEAATKSAAALVKEAEMIRGLNVLISENTLRRQLNDAAIGEAVEEATVLIATQKQGAETLRQFDSLMATVGPNTEAMADALNHAAESAAALGTISDDALRLNQQFSGGLITQERFALFLDDLVNRLVSLGFTLDEARAHLAAFGGAIGDALNTGGAWDGFVDDMKKSLGSGQATLEIFQASIQSVASTMATALAGGAVSGKKAIASLLADIAKMCLVYSLMFLAAGIAASTGIGMAAVQGTPSQLFAASAKFAAVGVAAGLASRAFGGVGAEGGGQSGGGGRHRGQGAATTPPGSNVAPANNPAVTIVVQGSLIGTDEDNLARDLLKLINTATGDGAVRG